MAVVVDAGPLIALFDPRDRLHRTVRSFVDRSADVFHVSPFVLAEVDYILSSSLGQVTELRFLLDVSQGDLHIAAFKHEDIGRCAELIARYKDLDIGLADASTVLLASRIGTTKILTFDHRHFRAMRALDGKPFVLLPDDEGDEG